MRPRTPLSACGLVLLLAGTVSARDFVEGTYRLEGKLGYWGAKFHSTLQLSKRSDGEFDAVRTFKYLGSGKAGAKLVGTATIENVHEREPDGERWTTQVRLKVTFPARQGASEALDARLSGVAAIKSDLTATYSIKNTGKVSGWLRVPDAGGKLQQVFEYSRQDTDSDASGEDDPGSEDDLDGVAGQPKLLAPRQGVFLAGQLVKTRVAAGDTVEVVQGPGTVTDLGLELTDAGAVQVRARRGDDVSPIVTLTVVKPEVVEVTVLDTVHLLDVKPPHLQRGLGEAAAKAQWEPATILTDDQLRLRVTLKAPQSLSWKTQVKLVATHGDLRIEGRVDLKDLAGGETTTLISSGALNEKIGVNAIELAWSSLAAREVALNKTKLRVYTTFQPPVVNEIRRKAGHPVATKLHMELACTWAAGASRNVARGGDSIGFKVDNNFRHHVAWKDYGTQGTWQWKPAIPHYPQGTPPPQNYSRLPGSVRFGKRSQAKIFYPRMGQIDFAHFAGNWGWWVLDNPEYAGGRCNQQASLICDIMGTLGIEAQVYYIERRGKGRTTGRAMRRYYRSNISGRSWNYHGQAKVTLADGTKWLYDGSGSSPPNRTNGSLTELMKVPGKYVKYWELWRYDDDGEDKNGNKNWYVPMSDWPKTHFGVPLQPGEEPLDPKAPDGTYHAKLGSGTTSLSQAIVFYVVNVNGEFLTKVNSPTPDAPSYKSAVHGDIVSWTDY